MSLQGFTVRTRRCVPDAPTPDDMGDALSFNSGLVIPEGGWEAVNEMVRMLENVADK